MAFSGISKFTINTKIREGAPSQQTEVTINWDGYTEDMAKQDLLAGASPRVTIQARLREDGIPKTLEIKACEWKQKRTRVETMVRPMTEDEILEYAKGNPEFAKRLLAAQTQE